MVVTKSQQENAPCVYCSLPEIRERAYFRDEYVWAFLTNIPITEGHTLIAPLRCVKTLEELSQEERTALFQMTERVMEVLRKTFDTEGFNCAWNQEKLAGQSIPHFHLHIIPRKAGDTGLIGYDPRSMLYRTGDREPTSEEELQRITNRIRSHLA